MKEIVEACRTNEVSDLIILHEHRGKPGKERRDKTGLFRVGLTKGIGGMNRWYGSVPLPLWPYCLLLIT